MPPGQGDPSMTDRTDHDQPLSEGAGLPEDAWPEAFQSLGDRPPRGDCPSAERLWQAVAGELEPEAFRQVVEHTARCSACAEDFRLTRTLVEQTRVEQSASAIRDEGTAGRAQGELVPFPLPAVRRLAPGLAIAAALILVVLSWRLRVDPPIEAPDPTYRSAPSTALVSELKDGAPLPRDRALLDWSGPDGARYDLVVTTDDLEVVAEARGLSESEFVIPSERLKGFAPGTILIWQVDANLEGGERLSSIGFRAELVDSFTSSE